MIFAYYIFAAILLFFSYRSFRGGVAYYNFFKSELSKPAGVYAPFATVIAPCKGVDEALEENLSSLLQQDYASYEVIFVIDSESDPAIKVIEKISHKDAETAKKTRLVVAPRTTDSSQKVENLREAVLHADDSSETFVFVDSDVRPNRDWLCSLIAPLADPDVGATTGYRWFLSDKTNFGSEMRSVWNASIASALGPNAKTNFCWGGSMAMRRNTFEHIDMREEWRGTLSDDFAVTRVVQRAGLSIVFVPHALVPSFGNCSLPELLEFTNRQMKITRVNAPHLWALSFFGSAVFVAVMTSSISLMLFGGSVNRWTAAAVFIIVALLSIGKSWLRLMAVELALSSRWPQVRKQRIAQNTLWILSPALFLINCLTATFSRRVTWRGIKYELKSPNETVIITD
jgi:cellulose synthase/poly-beta-1,6-N-acetylglucosamine synthase-like glycosyltransferase